MALEIKILDYGDIELESSFLVLGRDCGRTRRVPTYGFLILGGTWPVLVDTGYRSNQIMETLGMRQAILCGLSMGGYAAFAFLRKYPQRLSGLILADTRPGADTAEARANRENVAKIALAEGTEAIANMQLPRLISEYTRQHEPQVETRLRQMINEATPQGIAAASRGMALRLDSTDLLAGIQVPTLVIVGEQDALTPPDVARAYAQQIPNAQLVVIPHAGHISNMEQPEAFLLAVRGFLHNWYSP